MGRRLSQHDLGEIRHVTAIENSRARRAGKTPLGPQIVMFSCKCNCFVVDVLTDRSSQAGLYAR